LLGWTVVRWQGQIRVYYMPGLQASAWRLQEGFLFLAWLSLQQARIPQCNCRMNEKQCNCGMNVIHNSA